MSSLIPYQNNNLAKNALMLTQFRFSKVLKPIVEVTNRLKYSWCLHMHTSTHTHTHTQKHIYR